MSDGSTDRIAIVATAFNVREDSDAGIVIVLKPFPTMTGLYRGGMGEHSACLVPARSLELQDRRHEEI